VVWLESAAFAVDERGRVEERVATRDAAAATDEAPETAAAARRPGRAIAHALAEFDLPFVTVGPRDDLRAVLAVGRPTRPVRILAAGVREARR
jgi:hypothetical protein